MHTVVTHTELTRMLQWISAAYPGTHMHTVLWVGETDCVGEETVVNIRWLDTHMQTHWTLVRSAWMTAV
jgi:hypothetical protein